MASQWSYEGLDYLLGFFSTNTNPVTIPVYVGLFTSQTSTTIPSQDTKLTGGTSSPYVTGTSPVVEVPAASTNYKRILITSSAWGAPTTTGSARKITTQYNITFPQASSAWGTANGFFLTSTFASTGQNTGQAFFYSNFPSAKVIGTNNQLSFPVFITFSG